MVFKKKKGPKPSIDHLWRMLENQLIISKTGIESNIYFSFLPQIYLRVNQTGHEGRSVFTEISS